MTNETSTKLNAAFTAASREIAMLADQRGGFSLCVRDIMHRHLDAIIYELTDTDPARAGESD